jgi:DNA-3-methyladenine glycosylase II
MSSHRIFPVHRALLPAVPPFSLAASLAAMSGFRPSAGDQLIMSDRLRKGLAHPDDPHRAVVIEVAPRPDAEPGVALDVYAEHPLSAAGAVSVERWVRAWLSLDDDMRPLLELAADDPPVAALLPLVEGLHQVRFGSLAEGTAYFALAQRSTQWYATARKARIAAELGPRATLDGEVFVAFPGLAELAALGADGLLHFAGNAQRASRLADVLAGVAGLDEAWLRTAPYDEARQALLGVHGIGTFTANAILLRVLGRPDEVPLEMAQFTNAAAEVYGTGGPTPGQLRARYGPYIGWWSYLCRTALGHRRRASSAPASPAPGPALPGLRSAGSVSTGATREGRARRGPGPARADRAPSGTAA